jgi:hypothetical protein
MLYVVVALLGVVAGIFVAIPLVVTAAKDAGKAGMKAHKDGVKLSDNPYHRLSWFWGMGWMLAQNSQQLARYASMLEHPDNDNSRTTPPDDVA